MILNRLPQVVITAYNNYDYTRTPKVIGSSVTDEVAALADENAQPRSEKREHNMLRFC